MIILGADNSEEELLNILLEKAINYIKLYCGIEEITLKMESLAIDIAIILYNRMGAEGETSHTEGAISRSFSSEMPKSITSILDNYRKGKVNML